MDKENSNISSIYRQITDMTQNVSKDRVSDQEYISMMFRDAWLDVGMSLTEAAKKFKNKRAL